MNAELENLVSVWLDGRASEPDVRRLEALVLGDPEAARQILFASSLETNLGQLMCGPSQRAPQAAPSRSWLALISFAALVLLTVAGFTSALALYHSRNIERRRVADLESRVSQTPAPAVPAENAPRIIDTRGLVLLTSQESRNSVQVFAGASVPAQASLWTCPWGGADTRFPDDTSVSLDRSTTASFSESEGARHATLKSGILSVMRWPEKQGRTPMIIHAPQVSVTITNGQVVLTSNGQTTLVEVGMGNIQVTRNSDGRTITLTPRQYAVLKPGVDFQPVDGALRWILEPAQRTSENSTIN